MGSSPGLFLLQVSDIIYYINRPIFQLVKQHGNVFSYDSDNGKVVADMCVDGCCRDIIDYYDFFPDVQIEVMTAVDDENYHIVLVMLPVGCIVVERGTWYVCDYAKNMDLLNLEK